MIGNSNVEAVALAAWEVLPEASSLVFDTDLRYVVARGPALALHGFTSTDLEGQLAAAALPAERWNLFEPLYRGALVGETGAVEVTSRTEGRWCRVQVGPLRRRDGGIVGGVALAVDTTALKRSEERYLGLLESAPDAMVLVDAGGGIQFVNGETVSMFGYSREAMVGASVEMLIPERYQRHHVEQRASFNSDPEPRPLGRALDLRGRREDGSEFPIDVSLTPLETGEGTLVATVIRDMEAEQRVAESLTLLEALQSSAPVGLVFVDRKFCIERINNTLAAISGSSVEGQIGRPVADVLPALWPQFEPAYRQVLDTGEALLAEEVHVGIPDAARHLTFLTSYYPVRVRGELIGIGAVAIDITDRRDAEQFREAVLDSMAEGLYALDRDGRLTLMNSAASKMLGFSEDELRGRPMHEAIHYQHADGSPFPADECEVRLVCSEGRPFRKSDDSYTRKDGTVFPVAYAATPLGKAPESRGVVVVFRDTTEERA